MFASHIHRQYRVWYTGSPQKMRGRGTQTISFGDSSADFAASLACVFFSLLIVSEWNTNTLFHTALSICYTWRVLENVHGNKEWVIYWFIETTEAQFFFFFHIKALFFRLFPLGFIFVCKYLFLFLSRLIWRQCFTLLFFWQPCQSHKSNGMIGKSVAVTPNQFRVQLFTQLFHTPGRDPSLQQGHGSVL